MQTADKALSILQLYNVDRQWLGVTDISTALFLNKTTVHHLLGSLIASGLIEQSEETRRYRLGLGVVKLAGIKLAQLDLVKVATPTIKALMQETGETVVLSVLYEWQTLYLAKVDSPHPVRVASYVGGRGPLHCSADGKVLLAFQSEAVRDEYLSRPLHPYTENTIVNPGRMKRELQQVRKRGYAIDSQEYISHLTAIAAAVRAGSGDVVATIGIVVPTTRMSEAQQQRVLSSVVRSANELSAHMGFSAAPIS